AAVDLAGEDALRRAVRKEAHQQVEMRWRRPARVAPAALDLAQVPERARPGFDERVEAAAVEDDDDEVACGHRAMLPPMRDADDHRRPRRTRRPLDPPLGIDGLHRDLVPERRA